MTKLETYRIWLKNGKYVVATAINRDEAVKRAIREEKIKESNIKWVGKVKGRLFRWG